MDDINVIKAIRNGKPLTEFEDGSISGVMILAAMNARDAWDEIPEKMRNRRFAKMAVSKNFRHLSSVKKEDRPQCCSSFASWGDRISRKELDDFKKILNEQDNKFINNAVKQSPGIRRFVAKKTGSLDRNIQDHRLNGMHETSKKPQKERFYVDNDEFSSFDFANTDLGAIEEMTPEAYLARPVELQTQEDLERLLELPDRFPADFIERLQMPYRNAAFYKQAGDSERAALWEAKKIPWLNRQVCEKIALMHPEASVKTPGYLKPEFIQDFWDWALENNFDKKTLTEYYLSFPSEMLTEQMSKDIEVDWQVLRHTPQFFVGSETARLYLNRHPNDVFRLPGQYQTIGRIIADGTVLTLGNIVKIEDKEVRELIACAVGVELPEDNR